MKPLCIIPARGGSKRIPRKNIKLFLDLPMIAYSIQAALEAKIFERVIVSTDDQEIAHIATQFGAEVPFFRSEENSNDMSMTAEVLIEVLEELEKEEQIFTDVCCLYPTAPFISAERLKESFEKYVHSEANALVPVVQFSYPIQRCLRIHNNSLSMFWPENYSKRSQDLEPAYHDAGQFYWIKTKTLKSEKKLFVENTQAFILNQIEVQDIDNQDDWDVAEWKMKWLKTQKKSFS